MLNHTHTHTYTNSHNSITKTENKNTNTNTMKYINRHTQAINKNCQTHIITMAKHRNK